MSPSLVFIVNPAAGPRKHLSQITEIEEFCNTHNVTYDILLTKGCGDATRLAKEHSNKDIVVAVGGDGTVNEVVNGMIRSDVVLGIIPIGTGNDFAHQLGYTNDIRKNLSILLGTTIVNLDVGLFNNERYFVNGFSIGFDAEVAAQVKKFTKYVSGLPAYLASLLSVLPRYESKRISFTLDNNDMIVEMEDESFLLAVNNGTTYGGGFKVTPSAKMDDGVFTICFVKKISRSYALRHLYSFTKGTHLSLPEVMTYTAKAVRISQEGRAYVQLDGEVIEQSGEIKLSIEPKALKVLTS